MGKLNRFGAAIAVTTALALGVAGCNKQSDTPQAQDQNQQDPNYDPASANMAPVEGAAPENESATGSYQAPPPAQRVSNIAPAAAQAQTAPQTASSDVPPPPPDDASSYPADTTVPTTDVSADQSGYYDSSDVQQPIYAPEPPPPMPVYTQPACPGPNYLWTPGYWGYQSAGYYWVPGVWVIAPYLGALWTPGYWGWGGGHYGWNHGYWGPHIGYYGGINYGHGYAGSGYYGGYWNHNNFYYNRTITNVNTTVVRNVYVRNVTINNINIRNYNNTRVAYNGGRGGLTVRPTSAELVASRERHMPPLAAQTQHMRQAGQDRAQFFNVNHGQPQNTAMNRPLATPFHAPAAQPPVRGVANPGFGQQRQQLNRPEPQQHPVAAGGARPVQEGPGLMRPGVQQHPGPVERAGAHPITSPRQEVRPEPQQRMQSQQHPVEARPVQEQPRQEVRPQPQQRQSPVEVHSGARPAPVQHQEIRPQEHQQQRPAPVQQRQEARPQPQQRQEARPVPMQHQEARPAEQRSVPQERPQQHSQPHAEEHPHGR